MAIADHFLPQDSLHDFNMATSAVLAVLSQALLLRITSDDDGWAEQEQLSSIQNHQCLPCSDPFLQHIHHCRLSEGKGRSLFNNISRRGPLNCSCESSRLLTRWILLTALESLPTIAIVGIRCYLIIRQRSKSLHTISPSKASPRLESACAAAIQFLVLFWVILAAFILLVAVRAPICLNQPLPAWQNNLKEQNWRYGLSCRLHRGLVAFSVLLA